MAGASIPWFFRETEPVGWWVMAGLRYVGEVGRLKTLRQELS